MSMLKISDISTPKEWKFFSNGNANCLFKYEGNHKDLVGKLLRLRVQKDSSSYIPTRALHEFIETKCRQFQKEIVSSTLVLVSPEFISKLDSTIDLMIDEECGFIMVNVLEGDFETVKLSKNCAIHIKTQTNDLSEIRSIIVEMKPKWLYKNKSNYCRTCSLNQLKGFERHFCCLDLLHDETVPLGVRDLMSKIPNQVLQRLKDCNFRLEECLNAFFIDPKCIIRRLCSSQEIQDDRDQIKNLKSEKDVSQALSLSMTLRDVGLFIEISKRSSPKKSGENDKESGSKKIWKLSNEFSLTETLYDLDLKSPSKFKHWLHIENQLRDIYNSENPHWRFCSRY